MTSTSVSVLPYAAGSSRTAEIAPLPGQPQLLPVSPAPARHAVELVAEKGPWDGPTRRYRGARIEANEKGAVFGLFLVGHPMDGANTGSWEAIARLVDHWLDAARRIWTPSGPPSSGAGGRTRTRTLDR